MPLVGRTVLAAIVLVGCATSTHAASHELTLTGEVHDESGGTSVSRATTLRIFCEPAKGGVLGLELRVPQAFKLKDFDYDDFEGPDAVARDREHSWVDVGSGTSGTSTSFAANGWYAGDDPDTFVFGVTATSHRASKLATLLQSMDASDTTLGWVQGSVDRQRWLRATFALDPAKAAAIHAAIEPCLPTKK
jgi:hypothetical protein